MSRCNWEHHTVPDTSGEIFTIFILGEQMQNARTIPLQVDAHAIHVNGRNNTERRSKQLSVCNDCL